MLTLNTFRKFLWAVAALPLIALGSCSDDDDLDGALDDALSDCDSLVEVTYTATLPASATRAFADGTSATALYYALYNSDLTKVIDTNIGGTAVAMRTDLKADVTFRLNPGKEYVVVFWAQSPNVAAGAYTLDSAAATLTVDYTKIPSNSDVYDAFCYSERFVAKRGTPVVPAALTRPFAQINVGMTADDWTACAPVSTSISCNGTYTTLNLVTGAVSNSVNAQFKTAAVPSTTNSFPLGSDYYYVAMAYVLAPAASQSVFVDFNFISSNGLVGIDAARAATISRNHRTNYVYSE